jgi:hypothetical protein
MQSGNESSTQRQSPFGFIYTSLGRKFAAGAGALSFGGYFVVVSVTSYVATATELDNLQTRPDADVAFFLLTNLLTAYRGMLWGLFFTALGCVFMVSWLLERQRIQLQSR